MRNNPRAGSPMQAVTQGGSRVSSPVFIILKAVTVRITEFRAPWSL